MSETIADSHRCRSGTRSLWELPALKGLEAPARRGYELSSGSNAPAHEALAALQRLPAGLPGHARNPSRGAPEVPHLKALTSSAYLLRRGFTLCRVLSTQGCRPGFSALTSEPATASPGTHAPVRAYQHGRPVTRQCAIPAECVLRHPGVYAFPLLPSHFKPPRGHPLSPTHPRGARWRTCIP